jgi:hypothetical protein
MNCFVTICYLLCTTIILTGCKSVATFPISDAVQENTDDRIIGKWKAIEDTNKNNYFEVLAAHPNFKNQYHVTIWDRGGTNATYEANCYFSKVGVTRFLNIPYWEGDFENRGYIFLKIIDVDDKFERLTTSTVKDFSLRSLKSKEEVKAHISKNLKKPDFYSDTLHFVRMK